MVLPRAIKIHVDSSFYIVAADALQGVDCGLRSLISDEGLEERWIETVHGR